VKAYLDASSFAERFIDEDGSAKVETISAEATELGLSVLCVPEIVSALNRRRRERTLTRSHYDTAMRRLIEEVRDANIINLTNSVIASAITVLESSPVRTSDALYIACALEWEADLFRLIGQATDLCSKTSGPEDQGNMRSRVRTTRDSWAKCPCCSPRGVRPDGNRGSTGVEQLWAGSLDGSRPPAYDQVLFHQAVYAVLELSHHQR
jgi:predicted nucleic acid-binding protein